MHPRRFTHFSGHEKVYRAGLSGVKKPAFAKELILMVMVVKVTEDGVIIPKKLLNGAEEVEIRRERNLILVIPKGEEDPIFKLGTEPVACSLPDASENLDRYLYGNELRTALAFDKHFKQAGY